MCVHTGLVHLHVRCWDVRAADTENKLSIHVWAGQNLVERAERFRTLVVVPYRHASQRRQRAGVNS